MQTVDGRAPGLVRSAGWFAAALGIPVLALAAGHSLSGWLHLLLPVSWFWCLVDRDSQSLHDRLSGTRLVNKAPPAAIRSVDV